MSTTLFQSLLQRCGAWTGCAGEVELGCTACRRSCMAQESSNPSSACSLLSPWQVGRGAGSWGAVPGHISRPEMGVFLPDGCSLSQRWWSTCCRSRPKLVGKGAARLVKRNILNAFHSSSPQPMPARVCSLFSVNMVTASGPSKQAFQACCRSQGSSGHLGNVPGDCAAECC